MIRRLQNLDWDTSSPSHYKLVLPNREDTIDVSYVGDTWILFLNTAGHVSSKCFGRRDDAIGLVAQAFRNEGIIV